MPKISTIRQLPSKLNITQYLSAMNQKNQMTWFQKLKIRSLIILLIKKKGKTVKIYTLVRGRKIWSDEYGSWNEICTILRIKIERFSLSLHFSVTVEAIIIPRLINERKRTLRLVGDWKVSNSIRFDWKTRSRNCWKTWPPAITRGKLLHETIKDKGGSSTPIYPVLEFEKNSPIAREFYDGSTALASLPDDAGKKDSREFHPSRSWPPFDQEFHQTL